MRVSHLALCARVTTVAVCLAAAAPAAHAFERAALLERSAASTPVTFEVFLPPAANPAADALALAQVTPGASEYHHWLTPAEYRARFGTDQATMDAAAAELQAAGLTVAARHAHGLRVSGTVAAVERAFGTRLHRARYADGHETIAAESPLVLPPVLAAHAAVVPAFEGVIRAHVDSVSDDAAATTTPDNRVGAGGPYWFDDLKQAYAYPSYAALNGTGAKIGIFVSNAYNLPDIQAYFAHEKIATPALNEINVDGGAPFDPNGSKEVHLDIEQSGGMAPLASITHYNIPDLSDAHIADGLTEIVEQNAVDVVNMSFAGPELAYSPAFYGGGTNGYDIIRSENLLFRQGAMQGITFVGSSGDLGALSLPALACFQSGAKPGCGGFLLSAEFPASSPYVTAVGGTNLITTYAPPSLDSTYVSENAYSDPLRKDPFYGTPATNPRWGSGGGISVIFPKPDFQQGTNTGSAKYRTVPDVAGHMGGCIKDAVKPCEPDRSADWVGISGKYIPLHGTSASAPDFSGLVALRVQHEGGRQGSVNTLLYSMAAAQRVGTGPTVFRTAIPGDNGYYRTRPGYNLVLGNGTLYGAAFAGLPNGPFAGTPRSPSNP